MNSDKVKLFMQLAGQAYARTPHKGDAKLRELGARLLLSEVLEYVIKGLGVTPSFNGVAISDANTLEYQANNDLANPLEMLDGLADTAYTMYWNALAFGMPIEQAFELVCDNNLEKFVPLSNWSTGAGDLPSDLWHCHQDITWPAEVVTVTVLKVDDRYFAVGKDQSGKVRKPSSYKSVNLAELI
jgi:hypothetical protein